MLEKTPDLAALVGSRICHDLISPLGAIGNGVELSMMTGGSDGPEIALISESVSNANARIRFFRVAFGAANTGQSVAQGEIYSILMDITKSGRLSIDWALEGDQPRCEVKLAFLLIQCLETALPYGGDIVVEKKNGKWILHGKAERMTIEPDVWELLLNSGTQRPTKPSEVQFLLVPDAARRTRRNVRIDLQDKQITLIF